MLHDFANYQKSIQKQFWNHLYFSQNINVHIIVNISHCSIHIKSTVWLTISKTTKIDQIDQISKMKLLGVIIAVAAASAAISTDERRFCYCCLDGFQWACCTACILGGGGDGDDKLKVAESLTAIQVLLQKSLFNTVLILKFRPIWMGPKLKPVANAHFVIWMATTAQNASKAMLDVQLMSI